MMTSAAALAPAASDLTSAEPIILEESTEEITDRVDDFLADSSPAGEMGGQTTTSALLQLALDASSDWNGAPEPLRLRMIAAIHRAAREVALLEMQVV